MESKKANDFPSGMDRSKQNMLSENKKRLTVMRTHPGKPLLTYTPMLLKSLDFFDCQFCGFFDYIGRHSFFFQYLGCTFCFLFSFQSCENQVA